MSNCSVDATTQDIVSDLRDLSDVSLGDAGTLSNEVLKRVIQATAGPDAPVAAFNSSI